MHSLVSARFWHKADKLTELKGRFEREAEVQVAHSDREVFNKRRKSAWDSYMKKASPTKFRQLFFLSTMYWMA